MAGKRSKRLTNVTELPASSSLSHTHISLVPTGVVVDDRVGADPGPAAEAEHVPAGVDVRQVDALQLLGGRTTWNPSRRGWTRWPR